MESKGPSLLVGGSGELPRTGSEYSLNCLLGDADIRFIGLLSDAAGLGTVWLV